MPVDVSKIKFPTPSSDPMWLVQDDMKSKLEEGETAFCSCCGQTMKVYERKLRGSWMRSLEYLAQHGMASAVKMAELTQSRDYSHMKHWDLLKQMPGGWTITERGKAYVAGVVAIPQSVYLWQNRVVGYSATSVSVSDVASLVFDADVVEQPTEFAIVDAAE